MTQINQVEKSLEQPRKVWRNLDLVGITILWIIMRLCQGIRTKLTTKTRMRPIFHPMNSMLLSLGQIRHR